MRIVFEARPGDVVEASTDDRHQMANLLATLAANVLHSGGQVLKRVEAHLLEGKAKGTHPQTLRVQVGQ